MALHDEEAKLHTHRRFLVMRILSAALLWMFLLNTDSKDVSKNAGYV